MGHYDCKECGQYPTYCRCKVPEPDMNTLEQQIKAAEAHVAKLKAKQLDLKWPVKAKYFIHSDKDTNYSFKPFNDTYKEGSVAWDKLANTGHEITLDINMYADGTVKATHINGVKIVSPVYI